MNDFEEIIQLENGLRFYKTDLHIHYPINVKNESESFESGVTIEDVVDKLMEHNYNMVAIGHHNSFKAIQEVKKYVETHKDLVQKITILPSVELNLRENFHLVLIFPDTYSEDQIKDLLINFGLETPPDGEYDEEETLNYFENTKSVTKKGLDKILEKCKKAGIVVIAPHTTKDKGFDKTVNSRDRKRIINEYFLTILDCDELPEFYTVSNKYLEKKIAHIKCSDAHKLSDIGSTATYIKMDFPRYKSLQQIIYEPKLRILREEPVLKIKFKIIGIKIDGGMLKNIKIHFNDNYNAIIGGTGSGKSSIIDILKYTFGNFGLNNKFKKITLNRLRDIHITGTKFILYCQKNDKVYKIIREIPLIPKELKSKEIEDLISTLPNCTIYELIAGEFKKTNLNTYEIFRPVIFGQNELLEYSFDSQDLVNMFDLKVKDKIYYEYISLYEEIKKKINIIDDLDKSNEELENLSSHIEDIDKIINENQKLLEDIKESFPKMDIYKSEKQIYNTLVNKLKKDEEAIDNFLSRFDTEIELIDLTNLEDKGIFENINNLIQNILDIYKNIKTESEKFKDLKIKIQDIYENELKIIYDKYDSEFKKYCKNKDIQNVIAIQEYVSIQENEKAKIILKVQRIKKEIERFEEEKTQLFNNFQKLVKKNKSLFKKWKKYAELFTNQMLGATKIEIEPIIDYEEFEIILKEIDVNSSQIKKIIDQFKPNEFVELFLKEKDNFKEKLYELKFQTTTVNKIIGNFSEKLQLRCKLCLEKPIVKFSLRKNGNFHPIDELSTGERCATLLNFVFCQNDEPVIIDQPEDNIDYNYIKSTINILKKYKYIRQFIIVSHNQNLPVLADADLILTMNNILDQKIEIQHIGSLENEEIHSVILNLEGGREAFELRMKKYQLIEI